MAGKVNSDDQVIKKTLNSNYKTIWHFRTTRHALYYFCQICHTSYTMVIKWISLP